MELEGDAEVVSRLFQEGSSLTKGCVKEIASGATAPSASVERQLADTVFRKRTRAEARDYIMSSMPTGVSF